MIAAPDWRCPEERYGLYVIRDSELVLLCTGDSHAAMGLGFGLMLAEGELEGVKAIGVLDSHGSPDATGEWLVNPFERRGVKWI
jgi:hypothetical protein